MATEKMTVAVPLTCRFRDIPESAENLPKSEKMKFRQVGGPGTTTNLSLSDETWGENKNQGAPKSPLVINQSPESYSIQPFMKLKVSTRKRLLLPPRQLQKLSCK